MDMFLSRLTNILGNEIVITGSPDGDSVSPNGSAPLRNGDLALQMGEMQITDRGYTPYIGYSSETTAEMAPSKATEYFSPTMGHRPLHPTKVRRILFLMKNPSGDSDYSEVFAILATIEGFVRRLTSER